MSGHWGCNSAEDKMLNTGGSGKGKWQGLIMGYISELRRDSNEHITLQS